VATRQRPPALALTHTAVLLAPAAAWVNVQTRVDTSGCWPARPGLLRVASYAHRHICTLPRPPAPPPPPSPGDELGWALSRPGFDILRHWRSCMPLVMGKVTRSTCHHLALLALSMMQYGTSMPVMYIATARTQLAQPGRGAWAPSLMHGAVHIRIRARLP
jgi:hypothetical protein